MPLPAPATTTNFFDADQVPEADDLNSTAAIFRGETLWPVLKRMLHSEAEQHHIETEIGESAIQSNARAAEELRSLLSILSDVRSEVTAPPKVAADSSAAARALLPVVPLSKQPLLRDRLLALLDRVNTPTTGAGGNSARSDGASASSALSDAAVATPSDLLSRQRDRQSGGGLPSSPAAEAGGPLSRNPFGSQRELQVAEFIATGGQRPGSASGRPGSSSSSRQRPSSRGSNAAATTPSSDPSSSAAARPPSRSAAASTNSNRSTTSSSSSSAAHVAPFATLQPLKQNLRFDRIHLIVAELRALFAEEKASLLQDIDAVRAMIDDEMAAYTFKEPTPAEVAALAKSMEGIERRQVHKESVLALPDPKKRGGGLAPILKPRPPQ